MGETVQKSYWVTNHFKEKKLLIPVFFGVPSYSSQGELVD